MGRHAALWLLPLEGGGPAVDGITWPLGPAAAHERREDEDWAAASEAGCVPLASKDRAQ